MAKLIKAKQGIISFHIFLSIMLSCNEDCATQTISISRDICGIMLEFQSTADGTRIPVYFSFPESKQSPAKAVVVLHGSGGLWTSRDSNGDGVDDVCNLGSLEMQFENWEKALRAEGYAVAFPDSYSSRNTCENEGAYKVPPLRFAISGTFIRNQDAIGTLALLDKLVWQDTGTPVVDINNVALLGFSDGGTAVLSTVYNVRATPDNWTWQQSFDGVVYKKEIRPPAAPTDPRFKVAVAYYPGSYQNGYYGNICSEAAIYQSYCDILFHLATDDPLTDNTDCLIATMRRLGGGTAVVERYQDAVHGFDSNDEPESTIAQARTLTFLKQHLDGM